MSLNYSDRSYTKKWKNTTIKLKVVNFNSENPKLNTALKMSVKSNTIFYITKIIRTGRFDLNHLRNGVAID